MNFCISYCVRFSNKNKLANIMCIVFCVNLCSGAASISHIVVFVELKLSEGGKINLPTEYNVALPKLVHFNIYEADFST